MSFGYFYVNGGSLGQIEEGIVEFIQANYDEKVYISMNKQQIGEIQFNNGKIDKIVEIDHKKPFVFVLPSHCNNIKFYDVDGNVQVCMMSMIS